MEGVGLEEAGSEGKIFLGRRRGAARGIFPKSVTVSHGRFAGANDEHGNLTAMIR